MDETSQNNLNQMPDSRPTTEERSPEAIYQRFKSLARDFFVKHPPKTKAEQSGGKAFRDYIPELDKSETEGIRFAGSINPKTFLKLFKADPLEILIDQSTDPEKIDLKPARPIYTITQPTSEERKVATATIVTPEEIKQNQSLDQDFSLAIHNFQAFLRSPILEDGFGGNEEQHRKLRRPYRSSLYILANLIEEVSGQQSTPSFLKALNEFYAKNRLAKRQNLITAGVDLLRKLAKLPNQENLPWISKLTECISTYDQYNPPVEQPASESTIKWLEQEIPNHPEGSEERQSLENMLEKMKPQKVEQKKSTTTEKLPVYTQIATDILRLFSPSQPSNSSL